MNEITDLRAEIVQLKKLIADQMYAHELGARTALKTQDALIAMLRGEETSQAIADKLEAFVAARRVADHETLTQARDSALAIHESGHAVVAHGVGFELEAVEMDCATGNGGADYIMPDDADLVAEVAVTSAGYVAEHLARRASSMAYRDYLKIRRLLAHLPEAERASVHAEGFRQAETILVVEWDAVLRLAAELLARRWRDGSSIVIIEGDELMALLQGRAADA